MSFLIGYAWSAVFGFVVITIHGFLTALFSYIQGDNTPKNAGMLTLNPIKHFEPLGYIIFVLFGYGWGQPVATSAYGYKNRSLGSAITALAPIAIGIAYGIGLIALSRIGYLRFLGTLGVKAVIFAIYNLIPVYPLNGHKLLCGVLSPNAVMKYNQMEKILQLILMLLIFTGVINRIMGYIISFFVVI